MATTSGAAAYQQLRNPDNAISQGLQYWGNIAAQQGAEFRARAEREQIRKEADLKEWEDKFGQKVGDFKATLTGFNNPDDIALRYAMDTADEYTDLYREAEKAKMSGDRAKQKELEFELIKRKNSFKTFNDASSKLNEVFVKYGEDSAKGLVSGASANWEKQVQAIADSNYQVINRQGVPYLVGLDEDDNPFEIRYSDVIKGDYNYIKKQDIVGTVKKISNNLGSLTEKLSENLWITEQKLWNDKIEKGAEAMIDSVMTTDMVGDVLYSITGEPKDKNFTDEDRKRVKEHLLSGVKGAYEEEKKKYFDDKYGSYKLGQAKINEDIRQANMRDKIERGKLEIAKKEVAIKAQNAKTYADRLAFDKEKRDSNLPDVKISNPFTVKTGNGNVQYRTYTLSDKNNGMITPINIGVDKDGNGINISSVDISSKDGSFRYKDGSGKMVTVEAGKDPNLYNTIYNQIIGRDEIQTGGAQSSDSDPLNLGI